MSLTVAEILTLETFKTFTVIAGQTGLSREVSAIGILDYEMGDVIDENFKEGEFIITNLMSIKDDLSKLEDMIERLIRIKSAGLAIKTIYISEVPEAVLSLCNREGFPLFLFEDTFFEFIITAVMDALKTQIELEELEVQIDRMLSGEMNKYGIRRAALVVNRSFAEYVQVAYVKWQKGDEQSPVLSLRYASLLERRHKCVPYQNGYLIIVTADRPDQGELSRQMDHVFNQLGIGEDQQRGCSGEGIKLDKLDIAIQEAQYAYETASRYGLLRLNFPQMGLDRLLLPVKDNPWVMAYYESVMDPLLLYDQKNGTELVRTAVVYILSEGDVKLASQRIYQHGNTVRYRMDRIRQLLSDSDKTESSSEWSFYEMLAVGVRLHLIYTSDL